MNSSTLDLRDTLTGHRLLGLWRIMTGFPRNLLWHHGQHGCGAVAKTATYFLLRFFVDEVLGTEMGDKPLQSIGLGFVGLARMLFRVGEGIR